MQPSVQQPPPSPTYLWQTVTEFVLPYAAVDHGLLIAPLTTVSDAIGAPSAWLAHLQTAILEAVTHTVSARHDFAFTQLVHVCIYTSASAVLPPASTGAGRDHPVCKQSAAGSAPPAADPAAAKSWGFFLIEKWVERGFADPTQQLVVEVYIYQEV